MKTTLSQVLLLLLPHAAALAQGESVELEGQRFTLAPGFTLERVAAPPLVDRPMMADFDERGRLFVADSSGSNAAVKEQLETRPHRIVCLEDTDADGVFDRSTVYADRMMFPEGVLCHDGSVYVSAPPSIWKLTDTDDDGVADRREEWHEGKTLTGCANDLHGPYLGRDGWIYWAKGAFAEQTYARPNQSPFVSRAAHLFRRHPDQPWVEPVMTGGMDNPVEVVFTPEGERFFTTTFLQHPSGGFRDGIIHAIYGGVYGKEHGVLDGHARTGDLMPVMTHLGAAAPCGLALIESEVWGRDYQRNLFAASFNLRKITRHQLQRAGSSFTTVDSDFLVGDSLDFHPTDVLEDADGSLLVIDTGGWYKICCPTSQLEKPDVLGAIYRIRKTGATPPDDPRGSRMDWPADPKALAGRLRDPRPAVRQRAAGALTRLGEPAVAALVEAQMHFVDSEDRQTLLWTFCRIGTPSARNALRSALRNPEPSVRQVAAHAAGLWRDTGAFEGLLENLQGNHPPLRRACAEALGRLGRSEAVAELMKAFTQISADDRVMEHSLLYALIELADPERLIPYLDDSSPPIRRAAFVALDQMQPGASNATMALALAESDDEMLIEVAFQSMRRHPEWAPTLTPFIDALLKSDPAQAFRLLSYVAQHPEIQAFCAKALQDSHMVEPVLQSLAGQGIRQASPALLESFPPLLAGPHRALALEALRNLLRAAEAKRPEILDEALSTLARDPQAPLEQRLSALALTHPRSLDENGMALMGNGLLPSRPLRERSLVLPMLISVKFSVDQVPDLIDILPKLAPMETAHLLPVVVAHLPKDFVPTLVASLQAHPHRDSLPAALIRQTLDALDDSLDDASRKALENLLGRQTDEAAQLDQLLQALPEGDVRRGQTVFNSETTACITCHEIGYRGGSLGPDLTSIGQSRSRRDLLEAILFPSNSFVRSYESVTVTMDNGDQYLGIIRSEGAETLKLLLGPAAEIDLLRSEIASVDPAAISLMPRGLHAQLSRQELADLLAFLENTRWR